MSMNRRLLFVGILLTVGGLSFPTNFSLAADPQTETSQIVVPKTEINQPRIGDRPRNCIRYSKKPELIKLIPLPKNPQAGSSHCCGPNGCYPAPNNHPWNCGDAPIVLACDNLGLCSPQ